jgi:hypothetical protein
MIKRFIMLAATAMVAGGWDLASPPAARADSSTCERAIAKASAAYVQGLAKALARCQDGKVKGRIRPDDPCTTDPATIRTLESLRVGLFGDINRRCGGPNRDCGDPDDLPLASTGWGDVTVCPDFEGLGCTNPITSCSDISTCLQCIATRAVDQATATYAGEFDSAQFGTSSTVNRCQRAIIKGSSKFIRTRSKVLQRCWDAQLRGNHANPCPDPGDGRAEQKLAKAETRKIRTICRACGGPDKLCNGVGDLTPSDIGFAASCPAVSPIAGSSCAGAVVTLNDLVACIDCVADFKTDCADVAAVPELVSPYPATCNAGATTTTTSTTVTTTTSTTTPSTTTTSTPSTTTTSTPSTTTTSTTSTTTSTGPVTSTTTTTTTSSTTTTTIGSGPTILDFTNGTPGGTCGDTRNAGGTVLKTLTCGGLNIGGGTSVISEGPTPAGSVSRFALGCTGPSCTVSPTTAMPPVNTGGPDCTNTGCNFGTPLPIANPTIPVLSTCVINKWGQPASGTLDLGTGDASLNVVLASEVYLTGTALCPKCSAGGSPGSPGSGKCNSGARSGMDCMSTNPDGLTRDCPPNAATFIGTIPVNLAPAITGTRTATASGVGVFCTGQSTGAIGCFGNTTCRTITENGVAAGALSAGTPKSATLASTFCIPATNNGAIDGSASLPGPGAISLPGTFTVN